MNSPRTVTTSIPLGTYRKRHVGDLDADWRRAAALYEAGCAAAHFRAPRPVARHAESNTIEYEHLPAGSTLRRHIHLAVLSPGNRHLLQTTTLVARAGLALAELQRTLPMSDPCPAVIDLARLPGVSNSLIAHVSQRLGDAAYAPIHGDFWQGNIWIGDHGLILFDPIPSPHSPDPSANLGPVYYDVSYMIFSLWAVYPAWLLPLHRRSWVRELCAHFLAGYEAAAPCALERTTLHVLALYWLDRYLNLMPTRLGRVVTAVRSPLIRMVRARLLEETHRWAITEKVT